MTAPELTQPESPKPVEELGGQTYWRDAKGALVPAEVVKPEHKMEDGAVRALFGEAEVLSKAMRAFKDKAFADVDALNDLLDERYGARAGGLKGNITLTSYDGLKRVQVQVADQIQFGPELQTAKKLVDECVSEWSADSGAELRAVVMNAFRVDKEGQINRGALLGLLRLDIQDPRWVSAMTAIKDSMRVVGSKRYVRFACRANSQAPWVGVPLDLALA